MQANGAKKKHPHLKRNTIIAVIVGLLLVLAIKCSDQGDKHGAPNRQVLYHHADGWCLIDESAE